MADVGLIRKRVRAEIDAARKSAAERRERTAAAERAYEHFLTGIAVPVFRQIANVLRAEGISVRSADAVERRAPRRRTATATPSSSSSTPASIRRSR